jgi:prevent-host-death family protein
VFFSTPQVFEKTHLPTPYRGSERAERLDSITPFNAPEFDFRPKVATIATWEGHLVSTVGVKELKNCLTQYLRRTKQGEEVIVTERGNPIALIQPIKSAEKAVSLEARLARLAAQGLLALPTQKPLRKVRLVKISGKPISKAIVQDRR